MKKEWFSDFGNHHKDSKRRNGVWVEMDTSDFGLGLRTHNRRGTHSFQFSFAFLTINVAWWVK